MIFRTRKKKTKCEMCGEAITGEPSFIEVTYSDCVTGYNVCNGCYDVMDQYYNMMNEGKDARHMGDE